MYFVRFGPRSGDPVWCVDIFSRQSEQAPEIFGYMLEDAKNGFPVPFYPRCLQMAHEHAQIIGFDEDILQEEIIKAIRSNIPEEKRIALDELRFHTDLAKRRYS
jgi:hypothetical protein